MYNTPITAAGVISHSEDRKSSNEEILDNTHFLVESIVTS